MPAKKKPARATPSAAPRGRTASRSAASSAAKKKTAARRPATPRRPASPRRGARKAEPAEELQLHAEPEGGEPVALGDASAAIESVRTEVAVVGQTPGFETLLETPVAEGQPSEEIDRYREDVPVAIASLVLAVSPFLPWYKLTLFGDRSVTATGWETGTWGPLIAFLGALSFALAVARRIGIRIKMPFPDSTIHEAVGWIALVAAVIKFRAVPQAAGGNPRMGGTWGVWVAMAAAFALAFLAGRMSSGSPFVGVPGWRRGRAGMIGAALLLAVVGGSVAFGLLNNADVNRLAFGPQASGGSRPQNPNIVRGKFPNCAADFPKPAGAKPKDAVERRGQNPCVFTFTSGRTPDSLLGFYKGELDKAGWEYKVIEARTSVAGHAITFTKPECGSMSIQRAAGQSETNVIVALGSQCTPGQSPSPS